MTSIKFIENETRIASQRTKNTLMMKIGNISNFMNKIN